MTEANVDRENPFPDGMDVAGQAERMQQFGASLVDAAVADAAREAGRTVDEQWDRMGDHFTYQIAEGDPEQRQLDDYEVTGEFVEVRR